MLDPFGGVPALWAEIKEHAGVGSHGADRTVEFARRPAPGLDSFGIGLLLPSPEQGSGTAETTQPLVPFDAQECVPTPSEKRAFLRGGFAGHLLAHAGPCQDPAQSGAAQSQTTGTARKKPKERQKAVQ